MEIVDVELEVVSTKRRFISGRHAKETKDI